MPSVTDLGPLVMAPVLAEKPWGGRRLADFGKKLPAGAWIGESWEVADLPRSAVTTVADPRSRVGAGPHAGASLRELIERFGPELLGSAPPTADGDFPLLVKLLDAREHLSVQVHPDADYVARHPESRLKTESWYVVAAAPDAHLFLGLRRGVTTGDVASRLGTGAIADLLNVIPAAPGDFHHLPAGLVHALGAGVLVAEVQTPSDTTFRIYDWEDRYERPVRPLHATAALEAIRPDAESEMHRGPVEPGVRELLNSELYWIREHRSDGGELAFDPRSEARVVMVVAGAATAGDTQLPLGTTAVLPAVVCPTLAAAAAPGSVVLEIGLV